MRRIIPLLLLSFGSWSPAASQPFEMVKLPPVQERENPNAIPADSMRIMQKGFARCVYRRHRQKVTHFMRHSDFEGANFQELGFDKGEMFEDLTAAECMAKASVRGLNSFQVDMPVRVFRRLMAEEAYLANNPEPITLGEGSPELLSRQYASEIPTAHLRSITSFADCIVHKNAGLADSLLRTRPASEDEANAVHALIPSVSACIPQGVNMTLSAEKIRALAADGLYARYEKMATDLPSRLELGSEND